MALCDFYELYLRQTKHQAEKTQANPCFFPFFLRGLSKLKPTETSKFSRSIETFSPGMHEFPKNPAADTSGDVQSI